MAYDPTKKIGSGNMPPPGALKEIIKDSKRSHEGDALDRLQSDMEIGGAVADNQTRAQRERAQKERGDQGHSR